MRMQAWQLFEKGGCGRKDLHWAHENWVPNCVFSLCGGAVRHVWQEQAKCRKCKKVASVVLKANAGIWRPKRQRRDSNPRGQSPMDFESISLTTRTRCHAEAQRQSHICIFMMDAVQHFRRVDMALNSWCCGNALHLDVLVSFTKSVLTKKNPCLLFSV